MSAVITASLTCRSPCACTCLDDLRAERDQLLAALKLAKEVVDFAAYDCWLERGDKNKQVIDAAISAAEGS